MSTPLRRVASLHGQLLRIALLALGAAACDTGLPTTAEIEQMDAVTLEAHTMRAGTPRPHNITYFVDDRPVTLEEARAVTGDRIVRMEVARAPTDGSIMRIYTASSAEEEARIAAARRTASPAAIDIRHDSPGPVYLRGDEDGRLRLTPVDGFGGLLIIDGALSDAGALGRIDPNAVDRVEVIKGVAAVRLFDDPRAVNGIIRITTGPVRIPR